MNDRNDIVVLMAPLHGVSATRGELRRARKMKNFRGHRADLIIHTEAYSPKRRGLFVGLLLWKIFTGPRTPADPRGRIASWDVLMVARKHLKTIWKSARKVANRAEPLKIAPDRWMIIWVLLTRIGKVCFIGDHPHAGIRRTLRHDYPRMHEYIKQADARRQNIELALGRGEHVVAGGDLNYGPATGESWMPQQIFDDLKMNHIVTDVTWVAWSRSLILVNSDEIPASVNGQDHGWIMVTLRLNGLTQKEES